MRLERKTSLLLLISLSLFLVLSMLLPFLVRAAKPLFAEFFGPSADVENNLTYLFNAFFVSIPAFLVPAIIFRRTGRLPAFRAPKFGHIMLAVVIGLGCLQLNQALSCLNNAIFYNVQIESLSTTSETIMGLDGFNMLISLAIIPPLSEEFLMRGSLLEGWRRSSPVGAMILTSVIFALLHMAPTSIPVYFAIGILLALVYSITRNVWLTVTIHFVNNAASVFSAILLKGLSEVSGALGESGFTTDTASIGRGGLIMMFLFYSGAAAALIVPLMFALKKIYRSNKQGMYADDASAENDPAPDKAAVSAPSLMQEAVPEAAPAAEYAPVYEPSAEYAPLPERDTSAERKPSLLADPFLWVAIGVLILLNVISGLVEFGVLGL